MMKGIMISQQHYINQVYTDNYGYRSGPTCPIRDFAPLVLITSLALGVILAVVQFFLPGLFKTWAFTIHRSVKPQMIIWSKFLAALITFSMSLGLLWTLFYSYAAVPGRFYMPVFFKIYLEGWIYILSGLIAYWGTVLSAISTAHIYTTRKLGIAVAAAVIIFTLMQTSIASAVVWIVIGACILMIQIFHMFLAREF